MKFREFISLLFLFCCQVSFASVLKSGDIVFQTSKSRQSYAIMWASKSLFSHVGIIEVDNDKIYVIEAISKVSRTPFEKWQARGRFGRYSVYRYANLTDAQRNNIVVAAKSYLGRLYDPYFTSVNNDIYCSELVELAFQKNGITIGQIQQVRDLDVDNFAVRKLVSNRWRRHPLCKKINSFQQCWQTILDDKIITPIGLVRDRNMKQVA